MSFAALLHRTPVNAPTTATEGEILTGGLQRADAWRSLRDRKRQLDARSGWHEVGTTPECLPRRFSRWRD